MYFNNLNSHAFLHSGTNAYVDIFSLLVLHITLATDSFIFEYIFIHKLAERNLKDMYDIRWNLINEAWTYKMK